MANKFEEAMQIFQLFGEFQALAKELHDDGTLEKIEQAVQAGEAEFQKPAVAAFFSKLKQLVQHQ